MKFQDVAEAVNDVLTDELAGKGVLTKGEIIADKIMAMARATIEAAESGEGNPIVSLKKERKKRAVKTHKEVMQEAVSPLDSEAPDQPF